MTLRTCLHNGLGLDEFIVHAASCYVDAVADTDEVRLVVRSSNVCDTNFSHFRS